MLRAVAEWIWRASGVLLYARCCSALLRFIFLFHTSQTAVLFVVQCVQARLTVIVAPPIHLLRAAWLLLQGA